MSSLKKIFSLCIVSLFLGFSPLPSSALEFTVNKIAAVVNGEMVTLYDIKAQTFAELQKRGIAPSDPRAESIMRSILEARVNELLLSQEAVRYKISISDIDIENEINRIAKTNNLTRKKFEEQLVKQGSNVVELREQLRNGMLRQRMMTFMVAKKVAVTKDEIFDYFQKNKDQFIVGKNADFSVLIFKPNIDPQKVYAQIVSGSISFEQAAMKYSRDASAKNGGKVGIRPWDSMPKPFQDLLLKLSPGKISPLIGVEGSPAIIKLNSLSEGNPATLEEATPQIENILREPKLQSRFKEYMEQLRSKAVVDIRL